MFTTLGIAIIAGSAMDAAWLMQRRFAKLLVERLGRRAARVVLAVIGIGLIGLGRHGMRYVRHLLEPLPRARLLLRDQSGAYQAVNLETIHVTPVDLPPILGRDALEAFSAVLHMDFHARSGYLDLG